MLDEPLLPARSTTTARWGSADERAAAASLLLVAVLAARRRAWPAARVVGGGGEDRIHATTTFEDVADLAPGAPVFMADVRIGNVTGIDLDESGTPGHPGAGLRPRRRRARRRRGPAPPHQPPGREVRRAPAADRRAPTRRCWRTAPSSSRPRSWPTSRTWSPPAPTCSPPSAPPRSPPCSRRGPRASAARGPTSASLLDEPVGTVVGGFADNTDDITTLIESIDELASDAGPSAQQPRPGPRPSWPRPPGSSTTSRPSCWTSSTRCPTLSEEGGSILREHFERISHQIQGLRSVTRAVRTGRPAWTTSSSTPTSTTWP